MAARSSRYTHISLGSAADKIQLSGRQLQLLQQRRQRLDGPNPKLGLSQPTIQRKQGIVKTDKKSGKQHSWGDEPTSTAPTTSWESSAGPSSTGGHSASAASSEASSGSDPYKQFYGQGLQGSAKKLYDDTGASYHESKSEVSASSTTKSNSSHKKLEANTTGLTEALTKTSSHESTSLSTVEGDGHSTARSEVKSQGSSTSKSSSSHGQQKELARKADLKKRLLATMAEKRKEQGKPPTSALPQPKERRTSFGLNRQKKATAPDDQQRTFLRNLMQSAYVSKDSNKSKAQQQDDASDVSSQANSQSSRLSWSNRKSTTNFSTRSGSSGGSSTLEDKAIMRKVLERTRKKKMSSNPRRLNILKGSTPRLGKILSPRSNTSNETGNDERSQVQKATPKKVRRTPKFSKKSPQKEKSRNSVAARPSRLFAAASRWSSDSHADDEADSRTQSPGSRSSKSSMSAQRSSEEFHQTKVACDATSKNTTSDNSTSKACPSVASQQSITAKKEVEDRASMLSIAEKLDSSQLPRAPNSANIQHTLVAITDSTKTEEVDGYSDFVATLKAEVAGSHSQLWKSFHQLFSVEGRPPTPLKSTGNCQFDDKTKEMVTGISTYLKKNYGVECTTGTQLANDKAIKDNTSPNSSAFGQYLLKRSNVPTGSFSESSVSSDGSDKENARSLQEVSSADSINATSTGNEIEVTLGQYVRKSMGGHGNVQRPVNTFLPAPAPVLQKNSPRKANRIFPQDPEQKCQLQSTTPSAQADSTLPWSGIKLRSVADTNKSEATGSSIPTSWAKVKLRHVEDRTVHPEGELLETRDVEPTDFRRILVSKKKPTALTPVATPKENLPAAKEKEIIEIIDLADIPSTEGNPIDLTNKSNEGEPIDLTNLPAETPKTTTANSIGDTKANATVQTADGSVLVSLAPEPNSEPVKILIGKKGLVKIVAIAGEKKAQVIWRHDLEEIRSAMLDLSTFKVKLLLDDDNKDLAFSTSEQCMRFANALHEMTDSANREDIDEHDLGEDSVYVEQLNEEEQRVLEEFRQNKRQVSVPQKLHIGTEDHDTEKPMSEINAGTTGPSSPLSEVSGPGSALSSEELRTAQSYQKMLKLRIPREAVRHKMIQDQVDSKIVEFVLGVEAGVEDVPTQDKDSDENALSGAEQELASKYMKMVKMGIPPDAVRHKMQKEGVEQKIVAYVLGDDSHTNSSNEAPQVSTTALSPEEEKVSESYRKMLKMMIPKEAVAHKMKKDNIDPKIISAVVGDTADSSKPKGVASSGVVQLTDEEESMASSYRKMLSLRIPKEAIRKKMETEGISKKIIASVLGEKLDDSTSKSPIKRGKQGFHWSPLVPSAKLKNSVWSKSSLDSGLLDDDDDLSSHVEHFQKKPESDEMSKVTVKSTGEGKNMAKLIDLSRANNIAITLKAFTEFSQEELSQIIEFVDPFEKIKGDRALFMKDLLPASAEIKVIKTYSGPIDRLVPAEKWFRQIVHIKRIEEKINVLRTMESFRNEAIALSQTFQKLTKVCHQVMNSEKLPDLLEMVRQIGNRMNNGRGEEAAGFKLDFLPRLAQTKGSDKKTTALDLVVMIFNTRNRREALMLGNDFPDCHEASRIQIGELLADVKMLAGAMRKCQKELDELRKEAGKASRPRNKIPLESRSDSGADKHESENNEDEVHTAVASIHKELFAKRAKLIKSALKKTEGDKEDDCGEEEQSSSENSEIAYNLQGGITRIESFLVEANLVFPELERNRDMAITACKELSEFFCEAGGERMTPTLLGILAEFASNLNNAVEKYDYQQKAEARKKSSQEKKTQGGLSPLNSDSMSVKSNTTSEKKSLVLMVNEMLKMVGDKQKEDYINGITYDNPDSRLKAIYEAEERLRGSPRKNILRTIEERKYLQGTEDSQVALSELALAIQKRTESTDSLSPKATCDNQTKTESASESNIATLSLPPKKKAYRRSIAERWTRKLSDDEQVDEALVFNEDIEIEKSDSQILAADSHDSEDKKYEEKRRQQYVSRWASQKALLGPSSSDLEGESDVSTQDEILNKTRQQYMNRWASKPTESCDEDESDLDLFA